MSQKDELEKLFSTHGAIKDIRLVMHRSGTPGGLAYVEFANEMYAQKAVLKMDSEPNSTYEPILNLL
jgi:squamous cell carcinoma antigen recognized by T-cells 3